MWREIHVKDLLRVRMVGDGEPQKSIGMPRLELSFKMITLKVAARSRERPLAVKQDRKPR